MRDFTLYLHDILEAIESIESFVEGMEEKAFLADDKTTSAVVRKRIRERMQSHLSRPASRGVTGIQTDNGCEFCGSFKKLVKGLWLSHYLAFSEMPQPKPAGGAVREDNRAGGATGYCISGNQN